MFYTIQRKCCPAIIILSLHICSNVYADDEISNLLDLSLEELMNIEVSIASTKSENISSTPAVVSTYQVQEFMQQGIQTLEQALSLIPGIVVDEGTYGNSTVMIRGVVDAAGSKVLFLLDGIPYWSPSHNTIPTLGVPLEAIDRIEVIRGPGAVIYGTNAISGVINVITRSQAASKLALTLGSNDHFNVGGYFATDWDDGSWLAFSFEHQEQSGYLGEYRFDDISLDLKKPKEVSSAMVRYGNESLNLLFHIFEETVQGRNPPSAVNPAPLNDLPQFLSHEGYLAHADYSWKWDASELNVYTDYNNYTPTFDFAITHLIFDDDGKDNYRWRSGVRYSTDIPSLDGLNVLLGGEYENRNIGAYRAYLSDDLNSPLITLMDADSTDELSAYLQFDYAIAPWRFLAGARLTNNEKAGSKVTPRASIIYNFTNEQSLKLLYSVGFTSPNFVHTSINIPGLAVGDPDISAETITTIDLAYTYSTAQMFFVINAYTFDGEDFIVRVLNTNPGSSGTTYTNADKFSRKGMEIDFKQVFGAWSVIANASYNKEGNKTLDNDTQALTVPMKVFNLGAIWQLTPNHSIGTSIRSVSKRGTTDSYLVTNINYQYKQENLEAFITLRNITEEDPHNPDATTGMPRMSHPRGDDELNYLVGVKFHF